MADIPQRSDFNVEQLADRDATQLSGMRSAADESAAEQVRRALAELEHICAGLSGQERDELRTRIDGIQSQLASGVNPAQLLVTAVSAARLEAQGHQRTEASRTQAALYDGISLSAAAQARVNYRINALTLGNYGDYFVSATEDFYNRDLSEDEKKAIKTVSDEDTLSKDKVTPLTSEQDKEATYDREKGAAYLRQKREAAGTPEEKALYERALRIAMGRNQAMIEQIMSADGNIEQIKKIVEHAEAEDRNFKLSRIDDDPNIQLRLKKYFATSDGHAVDGEAVLRELASPDWPERARAAARNLDKKPEQLTASERRDIALLRTEIELTNNNEANALVLQTIHDAYKKRGQDGKEQAHIWDAILDNTVSASERIGLLQKELEATGVPTSEARVQAKNALEIIQELNNPEQSVRGANTAYAAMRQIRTSEAFSALSGAGLSKTDIDAFLRATRGDEETLSRVTLKAQTNPSYYESVRTQVQNVISSDFSEARSKLRYYNINRTEEGRDLLDNIAFGAITPEAALMQVNAIQHQKLNYMQSMGNIVPAFVEDTYITRVREIPGMTNTDGSLNVENLIELARKNRDILDASGETVKQRVDKSWDALTDAQRDARAVARTAAHFKVVDLIRTFGEEINHAYEKDGKNIQESTQLNKDLELYERMTNPADPIAQKQAIDQFLMRDDYYKVNDTLRNDLNEFVVTMSQNAPELFRSSDFVTMSSGVGNQGPLQVSVLNLEDYKPTIPTQILIEVSSPIIPEVTLTLTKEQKAALANEGALNSGDAVFQTQLEDRIQDVLNKLDMNMVVAKLGKHLGSYNEGDKQNITHHEIENALLAAGITDVRQLTDGKSTRVTADQLEEALKKANFTKPADILASPQPDIAAQAEPLAPNVHAGTPAALSSVATVSNSR